MGGNNEFFENFERKKYLKKLPSMQRVKCLFHSITDIYRDPHVTSYSAAPAEGT